jgi:large subunit ribosomal protein L25
MTLSLQAEKRTATGTKACAGLRKDGKVPAVVYGAGDETEAVTLNTKEFERIWNEAGESTVVNLEGLGKDKSVLIQEVAVDPLYGTPVHADLYAVRTDQAVEVEVPLSFVGVAPAEKELGGTLIKVMHALAIEALPKDLPSEIEIDIEALKTFNDQIQVKDVALPTGVTATVDAEEVVALVQEAREEEEPEVEAADVADVEVEKKGKEEEAPATEEGGAKE